MSWTWGWTLGLKLGWVHRPLPQPCSVLHENRDQNKGCCVTPNLQLFWRETRPHVLSCLCWKKAAASMFVLNCFTKVVWAILTEKVKSTCRLDQESTLQTKQTISRRKEGAQLLDHKALQFTNKAFVVYFQLPCLSVKVAQKFWAKLSFFLSSEQIRAANSVHSSHHNWFLGSSHWQLNLFLVPFQLTICLFSCHLGSCNSHTIQQCHCSFSAVEVSVCLFPGLTR